MDVAAVFLALVKSPVARNRLEAASKHRLTDADFERLAALAFLHDIGKLHPAFQAKAWPQGYSHGRPDGRPDGHTAESHSFVKLAFRQPQHPFHKLLQEMLRWGPALGPLLAGMFAHHGRPVRGPTDPTLAEWDRPPLRHYKWRQEADLMGKALQAWFPRAFELDTQPLPDQPSFHHLVAGFAALADWIGSDTRFFCYAEPFDIQYDRHAHRRAARAVQAMGQSGHVGATPSPTFQALTGFAEPNPAQSVMGAVEPAARLVILEAETGSGKTEAALWRFVQLRSAGKVSSLYFALPTRAAARQLHGRVQKDLNRLCGDDAPDVVLAVPGALKAGDHEAVQLPHWEVRWDDELPAPHRWAAEHATRFLSAEVAVGTVDQAMLAGLTVKHAHMRGSALSRSLLVIDEVHASDPYMTAILENLVDAHLAIGGHALLMSATLGARSRARWRKEQLPTFREAQDSPYPAVWVQGEPTPHTPKAVAAKGKMVAPELVGTMTPDKAAEVAVEAAREGARILVIRNTVERAVETWQAVQNLDAAGFLLQVAGAPALHHGRFAAEDRALLDREVEGSLAADPSRSSDGCIVVGTQTLEQSLDIDADFLVTDLCPMDVLLQRIGRLHRHKLNRPHGFKAARAVVMVPDGGLAPLLRPKFENGLGAWKTQDGGFHFIYGDLACLELTRRLIEGQPIWRIPDMNRALVEGATHPNCIDRFLAEQGEAWQTYHTNIGGVEAAGRMLAQLGCLDRSRGYLGTTFPTGDETIVTRLGEEGVLLEFEPVPGPFGHPISRIVVPSHMSHGLAREAAIGMARTEDRIELSVGERRFSYTREGLAPLQSLVQY